MEEEKRVKNKEQRNISKSIFGFVVPSDHTKKIAIVCNVLLVYYLLGFLFNSDDSIVLLLFKFIVILTIAMIFTIVLLYIGDLIRKRP